MNFDLKIEALTQLLGEKELSIFVLTQKVKELEEKLEQLSPERDAKADLKADKLVVVR